MIVETILRRAPDLGGGSRSCRSLRLSEVVIAQATGAVRRQERRERHWLAVVEARVQGRAIG
jgi:hypothetical protein